MNKGFKSHAKLLTQSVGNFAEIAVNINETDSNLHITMPVISTIGKNPISVSAIFNLAAATVPNALGLKTNFNFCSEITEINGGLEMGNADGTKDTYLSANDYYNIETGQSVRKVYDANKAIYHYEVKDKHGNIIEYALNSKLPTVIKKKNGDTVNFENTSAKYPVKISNTYGDELVFSGVSANRVGNIKYMRNNVCQSSVDILYDTYGYISAVIHYNENNEIIGRIAISVSNTQIVVKDVITGYRIKYTISGNKVTEFTDGYDDSFTRGNTTKIAYSGNRTTITDPFDKVSYVVFDKDSYPLYEVDSSGTLVKYFFNKVTNQIIGISSPIPLKDLGNNLAEEVFPVEGSSGTAKSFSDELLTLLSGAFSVNYSEGGSATYNIPVSGIATDTITAIVCGRFINDSYNNTDATINLSLPSTEIYCYENGSLTNINNEMDVAVIGITAKGSYSSIQVKITRPASTQMEISRLRVFKQSCGAFYKYDESGNLLECVAGNASESATYNENSMASTTLSGDSTHVRYIYNDKNQLIRSSHAYGAKAEYEYDETHTNNIRETVVTSATSPTKLKTSKTYTADGRFVAEETDANGLTVSYEYDNYGNIQSVRDNMSVVTNYEYLDNGLLSKLILANTSNAEKSEVSYTYDSKKRISTVKTDRGATYSFTYDNFDNITAVTIKGNPLFTYTYDEHNRIVTQKFSNMSGYFKFTYNSENLTDKIYYVENNTETLKYSYLYDIINRVSEVEDGDGNLLYKYNYDDEGRLLSIECTNSTIKYSYDNLGNVNSKSVLSNGKTVYQSFDTVSRSKGSNPRSILGCDFIKSGNRFFGLFDENSRLVNYDGATMSSVNHDGIEASLPVTRDGYITCCNISASQSLSYVVGSPQPSLTESGFVSFCFMPTANIGCCLFSITSANGVDTLTVYLNASGTATLKVSDHQGNSHTLCSISGVNFNKWNYFALSFLCDYEDPNFNKKFHIIMNINGKTSIFDQNDPVLVIRAFTTSLYNIGHNYVGFEIDHFVGKITCLCLNNPHDYVFDADFKSYYRVVKEYALDTTVINDTGAFCTVDFSDTNLYTTNSNIQSSFKLFPLHNSVNSTDGIRPEEFTPRQISEIDKDRNFEFNKLIKRYAYVADGLGRLKYRMAGGSGTVMMNVYPDGRSDKKYLFELKDSSGRTIGVFLDDYGDINVNINGTIEGVQADLSPNGWSMIGLSFNTLVISDSDPTTATMQLQVYINGFVFPIVGSFEFGTGELELLIGESFTETEIEDYDASTENEKTTYPLCGQIEMLAISDTYSTEATLNTLAAELEPYTKLSEYDDTGVLLLTSINHGKDVLLKDTYTWKHQSQSLSTLSVYEEELVWNGGETIRYFLPDLYGRATEVYDSVFGNHTYRYDYRGFLVEDDGAEITYNNDGNILTYGTNTFGYDYYLPNRLAMVNNYPITYDANNIYCPKTYRENTFIYEGRRLIGVNSVDMSASYKYDDQGRRIEKVFTDDYGITSTTKYVYDGDKLITEYGTNVERVDYLYDENGTLYGLLWNNNKYFYVRDHLQNILGIIDSTGTLVVKYNYTAYGRSISTTGTQANSIGRYNRMRYKGYYYDSETGFYYCHSRYYVPEWCRFLTPDHISFAEPTSSVGMNPFVYCNNNPIDYLRINSNTKYAAGTMVIYSSVNNSLESPPSVFSPIIKPLPKDSVSFKIILAQDAFRNGLLFGSASVTALNFSADNRSEISFKNAKFKVGIYTKGSLFNITGKVGIGDENKNIALIGSGDLGVANALFGLIIEPREGLYLFGVSAKASAVNARLALQFNFLNASIEVGVAFQALTAGRNFGFRISRNEISYNEGNSCIFGYDFYLRVKFN